MTNTNKPSSPYKGPTKAEVKKWRGDLLEELETKKVACNHCAIAIALFEVVQSKELTFREFMSEYIGLQDISPECKDNAWKMLCTEFRLEMENIQNLD